ncbi:hypothetical protein FACS1894141_1860 [Spirochaetia bacterium]|nr:hypothetical protein FACS1894141_1860 [Spirochaetia bacterium]
MMPSFLAAILSFFTGRKNPDRITQKSLKKIRKSIVSNKYGTFYRVQTREAGAPLAKFFFDVYRIVSPAQVFMRNAEKSAVLKQFVVESFLDERMHKAVNGLSPEAIAERAREAPPQELVSQLQMEMITLSNSFDHIQTATIDQCYGLIMAFTKFVSFDYFFIIKKFGARMAEHNFSTTPNFEPIGGGYIIEDLKDFLELALALEPDQDWKTVFKVLKQYRGDKSLIGVEQWHKLLLLLRDIRRSNILELIIRHIDKNPDWQPKPRMLETSVVASWLEAKRLTVEETIGQIINTQWDIQVSDLARTVFGNLEIRGLEYYTEKTGERSVRKNSDGFTQDMGLKYLTAFLTDIFDRDIRELCELLIIRGHWNPASLAFTLSDGLHTIAALADQITVLNESLNEDAKDLIGQANNTLLGIGRILQNLLNDFPKNPHELIFNWKELESACLDPLNQTLNEVHTKIRCFTELLQLFL